MHTNKQLHIEFQVLQWGGQVFLQNSAAIQTQLLVSDSISPQESPASRTLSAWQIECLRYWSWLMWTLPARSHHWHCCLLGREFLRSSVFIWASESFLLVVTQGISLRTKAEAFRRTREYSQRPPEKPLLWTASSAQRKWQVGSCGSRAKLLWRRDFRCCDDGEERPDCSPGWCEGTSPRQHGVARACFGPTVRALPHCCHVFGRLLPALQPFEFLVG